MRFEEVLPLLRNRKPIGFITPRLEIRLTGSGQMEIPVWALLADGWVDITEYVDFDTAWNAYEAGRQIQSEYGLLIYEKYETDRGDTFSSKEIRGKWIIL